MDHQRTTRKLMSVLAVALLIMIVPVTTHAEEVEDGSQSAGSLVSTLTLMDPLEDMEVIPELEEMEWYVHAFFADANSLTVFAPLHWEELAPIPDAQGTVGSLASADVSGPDSEELPTFSIALDVEGYASAGDSVELAILDSSVEKMGRKEILDILEELQWGWHGLDGELDALMDRLAEARDAGTSFAGVGQTGAIVAQLKESVEFDQATFTGVPAVMGGKYLMNIDDDIYFIEPLTMRSGPVGDPLEVHPMCHGSERTSSSMRVANIKRSPIPSLSSVNTDLRAGGWEYRFGYWGSCNSYNAKTSFYQGWVGTNDAKTTGRYSLEFGGVVEGDFERIGGSPWKPVGHTVRMQSPQFFYANPPVQVIHHIQYADGYQMLDKGSSSCSANQFRNSFPARVAVLAIPNLGVANTLIPDNWICKDRNPKFLSSHSGSPGRGIQIRDVATTGPTAVGGAIDTSYPQRSSEDGFDLEVRGSIWYTATFRACSDCHPDWQRGGHFMRLTIPFRTGWAT